MMNKLFVLFALLIVGSTTAFAVELTAADIAKARVWAKQLVQERATDDPEFVRASQIMSDLEITPLVNSPLFLSTIREYATLQDEVCRLVYPAGETGEWETREHAENFRWIALNHGDALTLECIK